MTLKSKLQQEKIYINPYNFKLTKESVENFEKIADDFAIGFAEWLLIIYNEDIIYDAYSKKELLEIYKIENDL